MIFIVVAPAHRCGNLPWDWPQPTWTMRGTQPEIVEKALHDVVDPSVQNPTCSQCSSPSDLARILGLHPRHLRILED